MVLEFFGVILSAVGALMALIHGKLDKENLAMKQLFIGLMLLLVGLIFIFYKPVQ